jgi:PAS domain S-box-containing protein
MMEKDGMEEQWYRAIIDTLPYALLVLDRQLQIVLCNRSCEGFLEQSAHAAGGDKLFTLLAHRDLQTQARAVLQNGGTRVVELYLDSTEGIPTVLRAVVTALRLEAETPVRCLLLLEDISERVRLEEQLVQSEKLAAMGLLAQSMAHELGNPLSIMTSTLQYVRDRLGQTGSPALTEAIDTIMESVNQMHGLLLDLSGFTGAPRPRFEATDLRRALAQVLALIQREAEQRHIQLVRQFDDPLPACQVDAREVKQLFLNLLKNALEAMPGGGTLAVTMRRVPHAAPEGEDKIRIEIADTGVGMTDSEVRAIFRPFYSTKPKGTGLGLPFCRRVVEDHGGEITVDSRVGVGSTFVVTLPVRQSEG